MTARLTSVTARPQMDLAALFARNRALYGATRMEGEGGAGGAGAGGAGAGAGGGAGGAGDKTFTQADMTATAAREAAEAERRALAKVAETLGMTPEEAATKLKAAQEAERAAMDEATRKAAEAADTKAAADRATAAAAQATLEAKVTQQLLVVGIDLGGEKATDEERSERMAMATRMVTVAPGADDAAIKAAIDRVKKNVPQLFTATEGAGSGGGNSDGGQGPPRRQQEAGPFGKEGNDEFDKRFPVKKQPAPV